MLKFLRKKGNQKKIFIGLAIIIVPAFVFWGSTSTMRSRRGEKNYAGEIFNRRISFQEYADSFQAVKNKMLMQIGDQIYKVKNLDLNALTWEHLILLNEAKKMRLRITDQELVDFIRGFPPFMKDGKFSQDIYEYRLRNDFQTTAREFEEQIRQDLMTSALLQNVVADSNTTVSDNEVLEAYKKENKKFSAKKFETEKSKWQEFLVQKKRLEALQKYLEDLKTQSRIKDYIPKNPSQ